MADPTSFLARLQRPRHPTDGTSWAFVLLPRPVSASLPRRGRTTVAGTLAGQPFTATLEPDGRRSHWLRVDAALQRAAGVQPGDDVLLVLAPVEEEPEPIVPPDLAAALDAAPEARAVWDDTTTIARVDWVHWVTSAKRPATRAKRIRDACEMLAEGKRRVCCFDPSGYYSKALCAPEAEEA